MQTVLPSPPPPNGNALLRRPKGEEDKEPLTAGMLTCLVFPSLVIHWFPVEKPSQTILTPVFSFPPPDTRNSRVGANLSHQVVKFPIFFFFYHSWRKRREVTLVKQDDNSVASVVKTYPSQCTCSAPFSLHLSLSASCVIFKDSVRYKPSAHQSHFSLWFLTWSTLSNSCLLSVFSSPEPFLTHTVLPAIFPR